nr:serine/threonine protein kinase [Actinomycetota bacterium]
MKCQRSGCAGTIEDGYCNVCGLAPTSAGTTPAPAGVAATGAPTGHGPAVGAVSGGVSRSVPSGVTSRTGSSRSGSGRTRGSGRSHLGHGLVEVPPVPYRDPAGAIMANPEIPEEKRFCARCAEPVGRGRGGAK